MNWVYLCVCSEEEVIRAVKSFDYDADLVLGQAEFVHMLTAAYAL